MLGKEGPLDLALGQRPILPLDGDDPASAYLRGVRNEALILAMEPLRDQVTSHRSENILKNEISESDISHSICHEPAVSLHELNIICFPGRAEWELKSLENPWLTARIEAQRLPIERPDCDSRATWKAHVWSQPPSAIPLSDSIRILQYAPKWAAGTPKSRQLLSWIWLVAARLPLLLSADDIALLRDALRALVVLDDPLAPELVNTLAKAWNQLDLVCI